MNGDDRPDVSTTVRTMVFGMPGVKRIPKGRHQPEKIVMDEWEWGLFWDACLKWDERGLDLFSKQNQA